MSLSVYLLIWLGSSIVMTGLFLLYKKGFYLAWVDVIWTTGIGIIASLGFYFTHTGQLRQTIIFFCILFWSLRLTYHLVNRIKIHGEDQRYLNLHFKWGKQADLKMFGIYQLQAFWCATFSSLPLMAIINVKPFQFYDIIGLGLFILAFTGEAIADHQLKIFKDRDSYRTEVCQRGLWAWSRHPNYFFEWLHWWSYVLFLIGTIYILPGILITLFMYYLINKVTGIPPTEERMLESRPQAYMEYQKITSPFFPLPPKF